MEKHDVMYDLFFILSPLKLARKMVVAFHVSAGKNIDVL